MASQARGKSLLQHRVADSGTPELTQRLPRGIFGVDLAGRLLLSGVARNYGHALLLIFEHLCWPLMCHRLHGRLARNVDGHTSLQKLKRSSKGMSVLTALTLRLGFA